MKNEKRMDECFMVKAIKATMVAMTIISMHGKMKTMIDIGVRQGVEGKIMSKQ